MTPLELRYRRLLALYPAAYRREYEDEMVTVLLADSEPGPPRPSFATTLDLVLGAVSVRLRATRRSLAGDAWRRAAPLAANFIFLLLAVRAVPVLAFLTTVTGAPPGWRMGLVMTAAGCAVWLIPFALFVTGLRRLATAAAGTLTAAVVLGTVFGYAPMLSMSSWYVAFLGLIATVASLVWRPSAAAWRRLGVSHAAALASALVLAEPLRQPVRVGPLTVPLSLPDDGYVSIAMAMVVVALLLFAARRLELAVAARVMALLVPAFVARLLAGSLNATDLPSDPREFGLRIVVALVAAPLTFGLGLVALGVLDRIVELVRLGRAAEAGRDEV